ncbi:conjugal transfer protein TraD, partial [Legionella pneumophila]
RKIELGGLVIKSGMSGHNKSVILGALDYAFSLMQEDYSYKDLFESRGTILFLDSS